MKKYFIIWAVVWIVVYAIVAGIGYPNAASNVLGVAVISLIIMLIMFGKTWKGEVFEVKTEEKHYADDEGHGETVDIEYAYIKLTDGKTKKIQNRGWKVGDKIEKNAVRLSLGLFLSLIPFPSWFYFSLLDIVVPSHRCHLHPKEKLFLLVV